MEFYLDGLDCAHCAEKIRSAAEEHPQIKNAQMNFMAKKLIITPHENTDEAVLCGEIDRIVKSFEPNVNTSLITKGSTANGTKKLVLSASGGEYKKCAEKLCSYAKALRSVENARFDSTGRLEIFLADEKAHDIVKSAVISYAKALFPDTKLLAENETAKRGIKSKTEIPVFTIVRLCVTAVIFAAGLFLHGSRYALWIFLSAYAIIGSDVVIKAVRNIIKGRPFDECFLMTIATIGAFFIGEYPEGAAVMFLYQLGEMFQDIAVNRSRKNIAELMDICPDTANVKRGGEIISIPPEDVSVGEIITVKPGEKIPLDGEVISGNSSADTSALTGESVPKSISPGENVHSGYVNLSGVIEIRTSKPYSESTVSKILELVENSAAKKARTENFITRFAKVYTPCVVAAAVLLAAIPMIIKGEYSSDFLYRALSFLVVSCPCALVISVPISFFGGIGGASSKGILVKGGNCLENMSKCRTIVFDKTGTLTCGSFSVTEINAVGMSENELLTLAASAESISTHPAAVSVTKYYGKPISSEISAEELPGRGVKADIDGKTVLVGNMQLMSDNGISAEKADGAGTILYIAANGKYAGYIRISDTLKPDAKNALATMKKSGLRTVMLTGDRKASAEVTAKELGIDEYYAELLPGDKVSKLEEIMSGGSVTAFVGDGINDAPVLTRADVGIAMGALGSDAAIEAADVVLMTDELQKINEAIYISKRTKGIVMQNIILSLAIKGVILILTAFGITSMWIAVFGDVGVALIAVLNAMRARVVRHMR